jgi:hypothetical protein
LVILAGWALQLALEKLVHDPRQKQTLKTVLNLGTQLIGLSLILLTIFGVPRQMRRGGTARSVPHLVTGDGKLDCQWSSHGKKSLVWSHQNKPTAECQNEILKDNGQSCGCETQNR